VRSQQPGNEQDQFPGNVEHDTIGDHAEPLPAEGVLQRDLFYRGLRAFPEISAYVRVSALMLRYAPFARLTLGEKTSLPTPLKATQQYNGWRFRLVSGSISGEVAE
jgi:hypothetical protein